ncbi:hypothetical protein VTK56DRAFT_4208 [Thermocarpiscus australiensis]
MPCLTLPRGRQKCSMAPSKTARWSPFWRALNSQLLLRAAAGWVPPFRLPIRRRVKLLGPARQGKYMLTWLDNALVKAMGEVYYVLCLWNSDGRDTRHSDAEQLGASVS